LSLDANDLVWRRKVWRAQGGGGGMRKDGWMDGWMDGCVA